MGVGLNKTTVWEHLKLLEQPKYVINDLLKGRSRTYYREADKAPKEVKERIKKKVAAGEYKSREEIIDDVHLTKLEPEKAELILQRKKSKESQNANRILNRVVKLALALEAAPLTQIDIKERRIIKNQLHWIREKIERYLNVINLKRRKNDHYKKNK